MGEPGWASPHLHLLAAETQEVSLRVQVEEGGELGGAPERIDGRRQEVGTKPSWLKKKKRRRSSLSNESCCFHIHNHYLLKEKWRGKEARCVFMLRCLVEVFSKKKGQAVL